MYVIIWEYRVKPERQSEFERVYAPDGAWADLFRGGAGYLGTELLRSDREAAAYITIDRWASEAAYENFLHTWKTAYNHLDEQCAGLTRNEQCIGAFSQLTS